MNNPLSVEDACADNAIKQIKNAFVQWGFMLLLLNVFLVAENLYYHEDLLGHILRHGALLLFFGAVINGLLGAGLLLESYWRVFIGFPGPGWIRLFRLLVFLLVLGFFAHLVRDFYLAHPVPHHPH